jgi:hypothetical protein
MPSDFDLTDDSETGAVNLLSPAPASAPRAPSRQVVQPPTPAEARRVQARHRIKLAGYYEAAQGAELFEDMNDPYAQQVQREVTQFLESRIEALTGVGETPAQAQFSDEEVAALKALAQRVMGDEEQASPVPSQPSVPPPTPPPPQRARAAAPAPARPAPRKPSQDAPAPAPAPQQAAPPPTPTPAAPKPAKGRWGGRRVKGQKAAAPQQAAPPPPPPGRIPFPASAQAMATAMQMKAHEALADAQVVEVK